MHHIAKHLQQKINVYQLNISMDADDKLSAVSVFIMLLVEIHLYFIFRTTALHACNKSQMKQQQHVSIRRYLS